MNHTPQCVAEFFVPGLPQPGGSKRAFFSPKLGRALIVDANPNAKGWQARVASFAQEVAPRELLDGALAVDVEFRMPRPKGHLGAKGVKASAPAWPISKPDASKLWRSTEDALTGVLWRDDARIVCQLVRKVYAEDGRTGANVRVFALPSAAVETLQAAGEVLVAGGLFDGLGEIRS